MKTQNLNGTNLSSELTPEFVSEIEAFLGKEIDQVYNYKVGYDRAKCRLETSQAHRHYSIRFHHFTKTNKCSFNFNTGVLSVVGRDKWKRSESVVAYQLEKVGYKLKTTHLPMCYIWGNPVLINN